MTANVTQAAPTLTQNALAYASPFATQTNLYGGGVLLLALAATAIYLRSNSELEVPVKKDDAPAKEDTKVTASDEKSEMGKVDSKDEKNEAGTKVLEGRAQDIKDWSLEIMKDASEAGYFKSMGLFAQAAVYNVAYAVQNLFNTLISVVYIFGENGFSNLGSNFGKTVMNLTNFVGSLFGAALPHVGTWWTNASIHMVARPEEA